MKPVARCIAKSCWVSIVVMLIVLVAAESVEFSTRIPQRVGNQPARYHTISSAGPCVHVRPLNPASISHASSPVVSHIVSCPRLCVSSILDLSLTILSHEHLKRWLQSRGRRELTNQHFVFIQHPINRQTRQKQPPSTTSLQSSNLPRKQSKERLVRSSLAVCITAKKI
jgi:hypothetical protein